MSNVHGLGSLKDDEAGKPPPDDDSQAFYVGGNSGQGGGSGLSVLDPNDPRAGNAGAAMNAGGAMNSIFSQAQAQTAGTADVPPPAPESGPGRVVTVYRNGFTVDNGPFRALDDPENAEFLQDMAQGVVPRELEAGAKGPVNVSLVDKRGEDYEKPPEPSYVAYSGAGQTVGGSAKVDDGALVSGDAGADEKPVVDDAQPTTTIMIRLHNGKRMKATLNLSHTVRHVQALISAEGAGSAPYVLMAGFPPAQLNDAAQTIEAAGLKGAQITQKLA